MMALHSCVQRMSATLRSKCLMSSGVLRNTVCTPTVYVSTYRNISTSHTNSPTSIFINKHLTHPSHGLESISSCRGNWFQQSVRFAGHSHWQNTRHIKAAHEKIRARNSVMVVQRIKVALKGGGGPDPKLNKDLERAFDLGKAKNIPMATLMEAVKRETQGLEKGSELFVEIRGHGNFFFIVECYTDKPARVRKHLKMLAKRYSAQLLEAGSAAHQFEKKGVVFVKQDANNLLDIDQATEIAIEVGAEEVVPATNEEKYDILEFHCDPKDLHSVKVALDEKKMKIQEHRFAFLPTSFLKLTEMELKIAGNLMDGILEDDEVIRIYDNIEVPQDPS